MIENFQFSAVCLASRQVTFSPRPPCNLHYFTKWGTVYRTRATYENQAILFCFAAALHRSSHSTGLPAERTYDVCCRRCMCTRYVLICRYSIPCSTGDHIANRTGVIFWFFGQKNCEARDTFPRRACMSGSFRSLCPFPFACLKNAKK